jgi:tubulin monoglycylase TTLL3/8
MKETKWYVPADSDSFFPKCFNLADDDMFEEFVEEFKMVKAEGVLKRFIASLETDKRMDLLMV